MSEAAAAVSGSRLPDGAVLVDAGTHRLKDLARPERIWLLTHPDLAEVTTPLRSLDAYRHNLPSMPTPLIGRRAEVRAVLSELETERLVTPHRSGRGREDAPRRAARRGGGRSVPRRGLVGGVGADRRPRGASTSAARGNGRVRGRHAPPIAVATDRLSAHGPALLILDNCEHLPGAAASLADTLRAGVPELVVLATSREPLGLPGEVTWRVPSLGVPPVDAHTGIEALGQFDSVRLFLDRAQRARPQFVLGDTQAAAVAEICHRLHGIPLAIELAAARCRQFPPERIAVELADRFRLLTGGSRTLLPCQQTLLASVEWSHDLLDDDERRVLRRLSVFAGSFRWESAEAVVASPGDIDRWTVLDVLGRLVDRSLVQLDEGLGDGPGGASGEGHYKLLETVRQFAVDRARQSGELPTLRDAHADWSIAELDRLDARQPTTETMALCNRHAPDLRNALDWLEADIDRRNRLLSLVCLCWSWRGRNDDVMAYGKRWLLDGPPEDEKQAGWALALAPCAPALFASLEQRAFDLAERAYAIVDRLEDAPAMIAPLRFVQPGRRTGHNGATAEPSILHRCSHGGGPADVRHRTLLQRPHRDGGSRCRSDGAGADP